MIFWRTYNNKVWDWKQVDRLGFPIECASQIPTSYLERQEFVVLRTCFGLGDWGIISAFPKKLKEKYPNSKVYVPSAALCRKMFGHLKSNWSSWEDPFRTPEIIFQENPYVDGFIDSFEGEVFNDHFRVYDGDKEEPLLKQILRFWQFDDLKNIDPQVWWTEEELYQATSIIRETVGTKELGIDNPFGTLLLSNRYEGEGLEKIQQKIDEYELPMFYWVKKEYRNSLKFTPALNLHHVPIRVQLAIKSMATFNIGNQTGVHDTIAGYAPTYTVPRANLGSNYLECQYYLR